MVLALALEFERGKALQFLKARLFVRIRGVTLTDRSRGRRGHTEGRDQ